MMRRAHEGTQGARRRDGRERGAEWVKARSHACKLELERHTCRDRGQGFVPCGEGRGQGRVQRQMPGQDMGRPALCVVARRLLAVLHVAQSGLGGGGRTPPLTMLTRLLAAWACGRRPSDRPALPPAWRRWH